MITWGIVAVVAAVGWIAVKKFKPAWAEEARQAYTRFREPFAIVKLLAAQGVIPKGKELATYLDLVEKKAGLLADESKAAEAWFHRWEKVYAADDSERALIEELGRQAREALQREIDTTMADIQKKQAEVIEKLDKWGKTPMLPPPTEIPPPPTLDVPLPEL